MRLLMCVAALCLISCASNEPPAPPAHPVIEGNWETVSRADILTALAIVRKDLTDRFGSSYPIYTVNISDRDHIDVCYWPNGIHTCAVLWRVKGKWTLQPFEKVVVPNANIPVG